jgi:hypothetical protein
MIDCDSTLASVIEFTSYSPWGSTVPTEPGATQISSPAGPAYVDRAHYGAVHFYGPQLHVPLRAAADYLQALEAKRGMPPHVVCAHDEFSAQDACGDLAWKVTLVLNEETGPLEL